MKYILLLSFLLTTITANAQWYFGDNEAVNLTNGIAYDNGVKVLTGSLDPSATPVSAPSGSLYISSSGTTYVKQDAGSSTNWLPFGIAAVGALATINGQSGPAVTIATGSSGTDFNIAASANTITLNLPSSSAANRGLLASADYSTFLSKQDAITGGATTILSADLTANRALISNGSGKVAVSAVTDTELGYVGGVTSAIQTQIDGKEPSISAATTADYWRGDKSFQPLDKAAVGLANVDNTSDASKNSAAVTLTNKSIDADANTITNIENADIKAGAAIDASKIADGSVSSAEFQRINSVTSNVQDQIDAKEPTITVLPTSKGGTDKNLTPVLGGVVYTDAGSMEILSPGTSGQVLQTNGAAAPTFVNKSISGKAQNTTAVTVEEIQVPNNQLTFISSGKYLTETGNQNILVDPSLEGANNSSAWVFTGGSLTIDNTPVHGVYNGLVQAAASSVLMTQSSSLYATEFADGVQGLASMRLRTSVTSTPVYVCPLRAGSLPSTITTGCVQVQANGKWGLYKVPFLLGGTSNGIALTTNGVSITGDIEWDDAFVGAVDLKQDINNVGPWTSGTCVSSWTTNTTTTCKYRQVGESMEVLHQMVFAGAPNATSLVLTIPSGFTIDTSKLTGTLVGLPVHTSGSLLDAGVQGYFIHAKYLTTTTLAVSYTTSGTDANTVTATNPFAVGNLDSGWVNYKVPVTQFSGASSVYSSICGANCVDIFSAKVSSTGVVSGENIDWINGNCSVSTSDFTCTHLTGIFTVEPNCSVLPDSVGDAATTKLAGASATSTNYRTTVSGALSAQAVEIICQKQGADFIATRNIIGSFNEIAVSPGISKPKRCIVTAGGASATLASPTVCAASPCIEIEDSCLAASAPTRSASGAYAVVFANGTWANSTRLKCEGQAYSSGALRKWLPFDNGNIRLSASSSGGGILDFRTTDAVGTNSDSFYQIECEGQAP